MRKWFSGQTVFITGGSSGIGAATAIEFARRGANVAIASRSEERLREVLQDIEDAGGRGLAVTCDVTDRESVDKTVAETVKAFGGIDVAVANAGFGVSGRFSSLTPDDFRRQFNTNVFGVLETVYAVLPHLERSRGRIGIVSSILGRFAMPATAPYCASKFALCGLAESMYYDLADMGISVTCIDPGLVATNFRRVDNKNVYHPDRNESAPGFLCVPAPKAARQIVRALYKRKFGATITGHGKVLAWASRHFPRTFRLLGRLATKGRLESIERRKKGRPA